MGIDYKNVDLSEPDEKYTLGFDCYNDEEEDDEDTYIHHNDFEEEMEEVVESDCKQETNTVEHMDWTIPLRSVENDIKIDEFGIREYMFRRVFDPDNNPTSFFEVFTKPIDSTRWIAKNGLLSNRYVIGKTDRFVNKIVDQIKISNEYVRTSKFWISWDGETEIQTTNLFEDDDIRMVFALVNNMSLESVANIENMNTKFIINIINSYDGTTSLRFNIQTKSTIEFENQNKYDFCDYFTLSRKSSRVIHARTISNMKSEIEHSIDHATTEISLLKEYNNVEQLDQYAEKIASCFKKKENAIFSSAWSNLADEFKNAFLLINITSCILSKSYNIESYLKLERVIDNLIYKIGISND